MPELTLESLAARVAELERELKFLNAAKPTPAKLGWRSVVGLFDDEPEFMMQVIAEGAALRQQERADGNGETKS